MYDMKYIDKILEAYQQHTYCYGGISDKYIEEAENILGMRLPQEYIEFLKQYGALEFGSVEIYGLMEPAIAGIPDMIWTTSALRKKYGLPISYAVIGYDGFGGYYCLDLSKRSVAGSCPVVIYNTVEDVEQSGGVAQSFLEFLFDQLKEEARNL